MTNYKLNIDSQAQTIQGFYVKNRKDFLALRSAIEASYLEGWRPTKKDVEQVYEYGLDPKHLAEARKAMQKRN